MTLRSLWFLWGLIKVEYIKGPVPNKFGAKICMTSLKIHMDRCLHKMWGRQIMQILYPTLVPILFNLYWRICWSFSLHKRCILYYELLLNCMNFMPFVSRQFCPFLLEESVKQLLLYSSSISCRLWYIFHQWDRGYMVWQFADWHSNSTGQIRI